MAYFFFDFRDTQKQHRRDLLSSLLFQLGAKSDSCYHVFSRFYLDHNEGVRQPSEDALLQCLMEMLEVQGQPAMYTIIDALDECLDISGMPTAHKKVLKSLEGLVGLQLRNVHSKVCSIGGSFPPDAFGLLKKKEKATVCSHLSSFLGPTFGYCRDCYDTHRDNVLISGLHEIVERLTPAAHQVRR